MMPKQVTPEMFDCAKCGVYARFGRTYVNPRLPDRLDSGEAFTGEYIIRDCGTCGYEFLERVCSYGYG